MAHEDANLPVLKGLGGGFMKSISSRFLAIILAITTIGMISVAVIGSVLAGAALHEQTLERISQATMLNSEKIDTWIKDHSQYVSAIAAGFANRSDISPEMIFSELVGHENNIEEFFCLYTGYPDGTGVFSDEWEPDYSEWRANEREWYVGAAAYGAKAFVTDLYVDATTGGLCITISHAIGQGNAVTGVVAADIMADVLDDLVKSIDVGPESYAFLTDGSGNILIHHNSDYTPVVDKDDEMIFKNIAEIYDGRYGALKQDAAKSNGSVRIVGEDGVARYYTAGRIDSNGWLLYTAIPTGIVNAPIYRQIWAAAILLVVVLSCAAALIYFTLKRLIVTPVKDITAAANLLANGETGIQLKDSYIGELALLASSFKGMEDFNRQQTGWLERIAKGDLSFDIQPRGVHDRTSHAIIAMLDNLNAMFSEVGASSAQVLTGSNQVAGGAQALAQGSTEQAAAVEELSSTIAEIAEKTRENAKMADEAAVLSNTIKTNAEKGNQQMEHLMRSVTEINEASQSISKVIKVIDDIAFQTNILALNAAVEAARAGQHGKGFAVVANEVRSLAAKSAGAAQETGAMIENSMTKSQLGLSIATQTSGSLREIVAGIVENAKIVFQIAQSSDEQAAAIAQINTGIHQVSQIVQQNSATAEESAAASQEMSGQAALLQDHIRRFTFKDTTAAQSFEREAKPGPKLIAAAAESTFPGSSMGKN